MDTWIIKLYWQNLGSYFVSAFLDDTIAMAEGYANTSLLTIAILQVFNRLAICY